MNIQELHGLDLNLLVALEAMLEERSVSKAAERLFVTQSAMSKTLGRLRELFDDPLFIRKAPGMVPTPRAEQLAEHLPQILQNVHAIVQPVEFDPLTYDGKLRLLLERDMGVWVMPMLLKRLRETAPKLLLRTISDAESPLEMLANGELDFILQGEHENYPENYRLITLGYAPPRLLARKGHPLEGKELTWDMLLQYPQVQLVIPELGEIHFQTPEDSALVKRVTAVVPQLRTDHLYTAIRVVLTSDYVFPAPPLFLVEDNLARGLVALNLPGVENVTITYVMVSHQRVEHSPAHEFLRGEILAVIDHFRQQHGLPWLADLRAQRKLPY